jgi:DNA-directed RNA polymerases I, II, and III subunit RPABC3
MSDSNLYEDNFRITELNHEKYDRVGRVSGTSADNLSTMTLDINSDVYPLLVGDNIQMQLVSTLNLDGSKDDEDERGWREKRGQTLADMFDYVCFGKVYKFEESEEADHM